MSAAELQEAQPLPTLAGIQHMQALMSAMPQLDLSEQTSHFFADENRIYCRLVARPEGSTIIGKVQTQEHIYVVLKGCVTVSGDGYRETHHAGAVIISQPGTKRAVYAHEDSVCMTVHFNPTGSQDLDAIEAALVEPDETSLFDSSNRPRRLK
jgi:hypothetical protein